MSFAPNDSITSDPVEHIRCQQHAARLFADDQFRLLPKNKFLFHVAFNINWPVVRNKTNLTVTLLETLKDEINMLVKSVDLPAYTIQADTLNQYNRKKIMQYSHKYGEAGISFNDDNMGLINQLWQTYYKFYYADSNAANTKGAYNRTATRPSSFITSPYGFNGPTASFFNYITIYQMARHEYVSYKLINPIITSWTGGKVAYAESSNPHNFDMRLGYEAVHYDFGYVDSGKMEGFGVTHYDWSPSPLSSEYLRNISTSPSFPRTTFGSTSKKVTTPAAATTVAKSTTSNGSLTTAGTTSQSAGGVTGITIPQTNTTQSTTATQVNLSTVSNNTTTTTAATQPGYTKHI